MAAADDERYSRQGLIRWWSQQRLRAARALTRLNLDATHLVTKPQFHEPSQPVSTAMSPGSIWFRSSSFVTGTRSSSFACSGYQRRRRPT